MRKGHWQAFCVAVTGKHTVDCSACQSLLNIKETGSAAQVVPHEPPMELVPLEDAKPDQQLVPFEQPMALVPHVAGWGVPFHFKLAY